MKSIIVTASLLLQITACNSRGDLPTGKKQESKESNAAVQEINDDTQKTELTEKIFAASEKYLVMSNKLEDLEKEQKSIDNYETELALITNKQQSNDIYLNLRNAYKTRNELSKELDTDEEALIEEIDTIQDSIRSIAISQEAQTKFINLLEQIGAFGILKGEIDRGIEVFDAEIANELMTPKTPGVASVIALNVGEVSTICPEGTVSGLSGRSGAVIDQISLSCDGEVQPPIGGTGGDEALPIECANNMVAKGIHGSAGDSLDSIGLICGPGDELDTKNSVKTNVIGGNGGSPFETTCPPRTVLLGIRAQLDDGATRLNSALPICAMLEVEEEETGEEE